MAAAAVPVHAAHLLFTPIFVMSRITGWTARITEQLAHDALIRPLASYAGPDRRAAPVNSSLAAHS